MSSKKPPLKFANNINEIINAFRPSPLETEEEINTFYFDGTMEVRVGNDVSSPIENLAAACKFPADRNAFLLMGHRGCGKSTELNKMAIGLRKEGYPVYKIECANELDMHNPNYSDLLILLGEALVKISEEYDLKISDKLKAEIISFWKTETEIAREDAREGNLAVETGGSIETPSFFASLFKIFASIKGDLKFSHTTREVHRQKISNRASAWLGMLRQLAADITEQLDYKQPIIIFEDLDKLDPGAAWDIFHNYASTLSGVSVPIIYTFPIALAYEKRSGVLDGYFKKEKMPIIKLENNDGRELTDGVKTILEIVKKRVKPELFETGVLKTLIKKTGGSLRDLFFAINTSAQLAIRRNKDTVSIDESTIALNEIKMDLQRRIYGDDYKNLRGLMDNNIEIQDKDNLLDLLQGNIVLEYQNGKHWYSVHPLVRDFLVENNLGLS